MRAAELGIEGVEPRLGPVPKRATIEYLTDPTIMSEILYRTEALTDDSYSELVNDVGWRAALLVLRAKALSGDVRALDLYLRLCKEDRERAAERSRAPERRVGATAFTGTARSSTTTNSG